MSETQPPQNRSFLIVLLVILVICAIPMVVVFMILRSIRRAFRRLGGGHRDEDAGSKAAVRETKKRARKAKAAYEAADRKLKRASARLAKAQAAPEAVEGGDSEESAVPAAASGTSPVMFWFNVGKWLAKFLIERQMGKLP